MLQMNVVQNRESIEYSSSILMINIRLPMINTCT